MELRVMAEEIMQQISSAGGNCDSIALIILTYRSPWLRTFSQSAYTRWNITAAHLSVGRQSNQTARHLFQELLSTTKAFSVARCTRIANLRQPMCSRCQLGEMPGSGTRDSTKGGKWRPCCNQIVESKPFSFCRGVTVTIKARRDQRTLLTVLGLVAVKSGQSG